MLGQSKLRYIALAAGTLLMLAGVALNACSSDSSKNASSDEEEDAGNDSGTSEDTGNSENPDSSLRMAMATLAAVGDSGTTGSATFAELDDGGVSVMISVQNAKEGKHGLHVHNGSDCTNPGPHFGPDGGPYHGEWSVDVGVDHTGTATIAATDITISPGQWSIVGHPLVLHQLSDAGSPPPRIACGNISETTSR